MKSCKFLSAMLLCAALGGWFRASAADKAEGDATVRPVNSSWMVEAGTSHLVDTYLSPLKYAGWHGGITYTRLQAMKLDPAGWVQRMEVEADADKAKNPAGNASLLRVKLASHWGMTRRWRLPHGLTLGAGAAAGVDVGAFYSSRNGNNPVAAKASASLSATAMATWATRVWRVPLMVGWESAMPLTGVFFSPAYDELYYEIYLGNRSGLLHPAWPGNFFRWHNRLTADIDCGSATRLRLGLGSELFSSKVNSITTRATTWSLIVGVTSDWISLSPRKAAPVAAPRIVYAY